MPPNTAKVDRSTIWGNPFRVGEIVSSHSGKVAITDNAMAMVLFRDQLERDGGYMGHTARRGSAWVSVADIRRELSGKSLACWCALDTPCHADVLLEMANRVEAS